MELGCLIFEFFFGSLRLFDFKLEKWIAPNMHKIWDIKPTSNSIIVIAATFPE